MNLLLQAKCSEIIKMQVSSHEKFNIEWHYNEPIITSKMYICNKNINLYLTMQMCGNFHCEHLF